MKIIMWDFYSENTKAKIEAFHNHLIKHKLLHITRPFKLNMEKL